MGKKWLANVGLILLIVFAVFLTGYYAGESPTGLAPRTSLCGNGVVEKGEQCDDGNRLRGDGCFSCRQEISRTPSSVCGNGVLETTESCDDGNRVANDGCSAVCFVEVPASTRRSCGNGAVDSGEMCDDGGICTSDNNTPCTSNSQCPRFRGFAGRCAPRNGDGCDLSCMVEGRDTTRDIIVEVENSVSDSVEFGLESVCPSGRCSASATEVTASNIDSSVYEGGRFIAAVRLECTGDIESSTVQFNVGSSVGTTCTDLRVSHVSDSGSVQRLEPTSCGSGSGGSLDVTVTFNGCSHVVVWEEESCSPSPEVCTDRIDNDCDGHVNEGCQETFCDDLDDNANGQVDEGCDDDGDDYCQVRGYYSGSWFDFTVVGTPAVCPNGGGDCYDGCQGQGCGSRVADFAAVNPGAVENCFLDIGYNDENCNGQVDEGCSPYTCSDNDEANDPLIGSIVTITSANGQTINFGDSCINSELVNETVCGPSSPYAPYYSHTSVRVDCPSGTTCSDPDSSTGSTPAVCS